MACNLVRAMYKLDGGKLNSCFDADSKDRKDLQPSTYESHTHLAHVVVKYLGLDAPGQLGAYGITTAADLVDLISRVRRPFASHLFRGLILTCVYSLSRTQSP